MEKFAIPPDQASYAVIPGNETLRAQLDGGRGRYRRDIIGGWSTVSAQWTLDREEYAYVCAFQRTATKKGSLPFLADLYLEGSDVVEYECYFIPETFQLISQAGHTFVVTAQLEAKPPAIDEEYDNGIIMAFNAYGGNSSAIFNILEQLVNVDLNAIG